MNCKIQTLCVKTNIRGSFTPLEVINEDCLKLLYYHHQNFTMCQRVVEIRRNEGIQDSSKQLEPDLSKVCIQIIGLGLPRDNCVVYGYDYSHCIYDVEIFTSLSVLQKFGRFFEKIPHNSYTAFVSMEKNDTFIPIFVKALLRQLGRKPPIDAKYDPNIVQTWLSNNEARMDLILHTLISNDTHID